MGIDKDNSKKTTFVKLKLLIIILSVFLVLGLIIFLVIRLINNEEITYQEKLYYITLEGEPSVTLYQGDIYNEPGYSAKDDNGKDVTKNIVITDNVNTNKVGEYKISYTIGNITKERIIKVIEKPIGATYIHLYGDVNTYLYVGETYIENGYEVIDSVDSNLKDKVKINNNVDTSKEGIYKVIYSVTNSSNVTTSKERTVIVMDRSLSLIPDITDITNKNITININIKDELFDYLILPNNLKITDRMSTYEVNSNGTYKFVMYNKKGESKEKEIEITNIDKEAPTGSCSGYAKGNNSYITVDAKDNVGISKYMIDDTSYTANNITINKALTEVNIIIYDKAGNKASTSCLLDDKGGNVPTNSGIQPTPGNLIMINEDTALDKRKNNGVTVYKRKLGNTVYYEAIPDGATENMPLIVYLRGGAQRGTFDKIDDTFKESSMAMVYSGEAYSYQKFIFLYPSYIVYGQASYGRVKQIIDNVVKEYHIDTNKIVLTGHSDGGVATCWIANRYPNFFSAVVPMSATAPIEAKNLVNASFWGFSGVIRNDKAEGNVMKKYVQRINALNPKVPAYFTDNDESFRQKIIMDLGREPATVPGYEKYDHSTIKKFYYMPELWEWMLKQ